MREKTFLLGLAVVALSACATPEEEAGGLEVEIAELSSALNADAEPSTGDDESEAEEGAVESEEKSEVSVEKNETIADPVESESNEVVDDIDDQEFTAYTENYDLIEGIAGLSEDRGYGYGTVSEIVFPRGASSTTASDAVVRAQANVHFFSISEDSEKLEIQITSLEENGVFRIIGPDGLETPGEGSITGYESPAEKGDYAILVTSVRGNASYELDVAVK